ncbi:MAG: mannose-1-phosphate guanylyltransferase [Anaerolineae bacterium]
MNNKTHFYAVIMAGGGGTRLWPLSRTAHPKQMLTLFGERSMFQMSVDRLRPLFPPERIFVVTAGEQVEPLSNQAPELPRDNFIVEPMGRGTAPCIGLAAIHLQRRDPQAMMAVLTADHYIEEEAVFRAALTAAREVAEEGYLVTLGIPPTFPSTGYGYISRGKTLGEKGDFPYYRVQRFTEKPDAETARRFLEAGTYSWNSGMFIWRTERILEEMATLMPELHRTLERLQDTLAGDDYDATLNQVWPRVEKETIDYGVMERAGRVAVIPVEMGWSDVGSWDAVQARLPADEHDNVCRGDHIAVETTGTMVFSRSDHLIATVGVENLIVVDTPDAMLITTPEHAGQVREVVRRLREAGREDKL